ncbi:MAG: cobalamin receptor protein, partial [Bacteroidota bacterium]
QMTLSGGSHRFAWNTSGFGIVQGSLEAPEYILSNTGKREYGGSFNTLFHLPALELNISGSYLDQELGILRGSIVGNLTDLQNAIESGIPRPTFERTYDIQNPRHVIQHGLLKTDLQLYLGEHIFKLQHGFQRNDRQEYDVRRGELNDRPVIDLNLDSHTAEIQWTQPTTGKWSGNSGIQFFSQNSKNEPGSNPINFVPNYKVNNYGVYSIQSVDLGQTIIELGVRMDHQRLAVNDTIREVTVY